MEEADLGEVKIYQPGKCNIGNTNRVFRLSYGVLFLALSAYLWIGLASYGVLAKVFIAVPLYVGFLGLYQGLASFCIYHAKRRTYDMR